MSSKIQESITDEQALLREKLRKLANVVGEEIDRNRKYLVGKVLTVVDATTSDAQQRKATKDLVEGAFYGDTLRSPYGQAYEALDYQLRQLAASEGFELWENPPSGQHPVPVEFNEYSKIKVN